VPTIEPTFTSKTKSLKIYVFAFEVLEADSYAIDLTRRVPIFVLEIDAVDDVLIETTLTQCKSTVCKLFIGNEP